MHPRNGMATNALLKRTCPEDPEYGSWVKSLKPEVIIGNTSRKANELEEAPQKSCPFHRLAIVERNRL